jgi:hypothetical protein
LRDACAQPPVFGIVVDGGTVARARHGHAKLCAERGVGAGRQRDDAIGQQQCLVDVVGDQHDGLAFDRTDGLDLILQLGARQGIERG